MKLDDSTLADYLRERGLVARDAEVRVETAGAGNINYVRRVRAGGRSFVVKHARPRLERFPEYEAPVDRIVFEHRYGEVVRERAPSVASVLPAPLHFDAEQSVLVMEDLGDAPLLEQLLESGREPLEPLRRLGRFLGTVHRVMRADADALALRFQNASMQRLHGEHIFTLPYGPNDFPIAPPVRERAERELARPGVRERIEKLREHYYGDRTALVHADVQATNVLVQGDQPRLLDAEIAHVGDPGFDLGTALAHLEFHACRPGASIGVERAEAALLEGYREGSAAAEPARARPYAGVEMLRRTIGAARKSFLEDEQVAARVIPRAIGMLLG